eukprot:g2200.t1
MAEHHQFYIRRADLTSTAYSSFHSTESLDDRFRCLMDRSFQFVKKCGDIAAALPSQASEDSDSDVESCDQNQEEIHRKIETVVTSDPHQDSFCSLMERTRLFYRRCLLASQSRI